MYAYSGKTDLAVTFLFLPALACAWVDLGWGGGVTLGWRVLAGLLLGLSAVEAWRANRCPWRALAAFPVKHVLAAALVVCALVAGGGAMTLTSGQDKKSRIGNAVTAGAAVLGFVIVRHWIKKLTRPAAMR